MDQNELDQFLGEPLNDVSENIVGAIGGANSIVDPSTNNNSSYQTGFSRSHRGNRGNRGNLNYSYQTQETAWRTLRFQQEQQRKAEAEFESKKATWQIKASLVQKSLNNERNENRNAKQSNEACENQLKEQSRRLDEKHNAMLMAERTGKVSHLVALFEVQSGRRIDCHQKKRLKLCEAIERAKPILDETDTLTMKALQEEQVPEWIKNEVLPHEKLFMLTPGVILSFNALAEYRERFKLMTFI